MLLAGTAGGGLLALVALPACANVPRHVVPLARIEQAVATRFPLRLDAAGLFRLELQAPRLRLVPEQNRIRSEMQVEAGGDALRHRYTGLFDLDFLLRYEAADQTVRAHLPRVHALRLDGLPPRAAEVVAALGPRLAQEALQDMVLHRLDARDLTLPDTMGLQPDTITVTAEGLAIEFKPKPPPPRAQP